MGRMPIYREAGKPYASDFVSRSYLLSAVPPNWGGTVDRRVSCCMSTEHLERRGDGFRGRAFRATVLRRSDLIELHRISKRLPGVGDILSNVSLTVDRGAFVAIVGPSGCGKSTLLRLVAGLDAPSQGEIARPPDMGCGFVFQEPTLMPWASVHDNVWLPLRVRGVSREDAASKIDEVLHRVGLSNRADAVPAELSGGMKMRASIARALVTEPELLLLDEPFAALDEITRQRLNDELLDLWLRDGFTAIFVTHSVYEAVALSQRVIVMAANPGRIVQDLHIEAAGARDASFRSSATYVRACAAVSAALASASNGLAG